MQIFLFFILLFCFLQPVLADPVILLDERWLQGDNTNEGLAARGWNGAPQEGSIGLAYIFVFDPQRNKTVLQINWDDSGNEAPMGASALQHFLPTDQGQTAGGVTLYYTFKTHDWFNQGASGHSHFMRLLQNYWDPNGGMGPAPNQLNLDIGGYGSDDYATEYFDNTSFNASRSIFFSGGTYASVAGYKTPDPTDYLVDDTWYIVRVFIQPQYYAGVPSGHIFGQIRRMDPPDPNHPDGWTTIIQADNVILSDMGGVITQVAIGPYHNPAGNVPHQLFVGGVVIFQGFYMP